jgi:hypothetical protein
MRPRAPGDAPSWLSVKELGQLGKDHVENEKTVISPPGRDRATFLVAWVGET